MSDLIVVGFKGEDTADQVLNKLAALQREHLIDLEDACVVVRDQNGEVRLKQAVGLVGAGALTGGTWGAMWGTLIGLLFLNPLAGLLSGAAFGAGAGALSGALADYGIEDEFIRSLGATIQPGSSALFVLVRRATPDKVLPELRQFQGTVLRTSLSNEQEERLKQALQDVKA
ncbi:MAG: DUF1269 domain-containing protein [Candidatus Entotheonellia bacterium]